MLCEFLFMDSANELCICFRCSLRAAAAASKKMSPSDRSAFEQKRTSLQRKIVKWCGIQSIYMPRVLEYRLAGAATSERGSNGGTSSAPATEVNNDEDEDDDDEQDEENSGETKAGPLGMGDQPESFDLLLPSGLPRHLRSTCDQTLLEKEKQIRIASLETLLCSLRKLLRLKAGIYLDKKRHQTGQVACTRSNSELSTFNSKVESVAQRYRFVRTALLKIDPNGTWKNRLLDLKKDDIRAAQHDIEEREKRRSKGLGEGKRELSWIYKMRAEGSDEVEDKSYTDGRLSYVLLV